MAAQPMLTRPGTQRVVLGCDVNVLNVVTQKIQAEGVEVEHVYDY